MTSVDPPTPPLPLIINFLLTFTALWTWPHPSSGHSPDLSDVALTLETSTSLLVTCGTSCSPWNRNRLLVPLARELGYTPVHHPSDPHLLIRTYAIPDDVADPESFLHSIGFNARMSIPVAAHGWPETGLDCEAPPLEGAMKSPTETFRLTFGDSGPKVESCPAVSHRSD